MSARHLIGAAVALSFVTAPAAAQPLFSLYGDVRLDPVPFWAQPLASVYGADGAGYLVGGSGNTIDPVLCARERASQGDPEDVRLPFSAPGGVSGFLASYGLTVVDEGGPRRPVQVVLSNIDGTLSVRRIACADIPASPPAGFQPPLETGAPIPVDWEGRTPEAFQPPQAPLSIYANALAWEDRVCLPLAQGIWCVDLAASAPAFRRWVTADDVGGQIGLGTVTATLPHHVPGELEYDLAETRWAFRSLTALPGGRVAAVVETAPEQDDNRAARAAYLVLVDPDGEVARVLYGPSTQWRLANEDVATNLRAPLQQCDRLAYEPTLDAVLAGPLDGWEWSGAWPVRPTDDGSPLGWYGRGFLVLPLSDGGAGYLPLSDAISRSTYQLPTGGPIGGGLRDWIPLLGGFAPLGDGRVLVSLEYPHADGGSWYELSWDEGALDLDRDGLDRAREAALHTSDYAWDSDDDGLEDGYEDVLGADPAVRDGTSDARAFDGTRATWSLSPLLRTWRLPAVGPDAGFYPDVSGNVGVDGPLCVDGLCYDAAGRVVGSGTGTISADGRVAVDWADERQRALVGVDLTSGERWEWVSISALEALLETERLSYAGFFPEDRGSLLIVVWSNPPAGERFWVVRADSSGALSVRYDHLAAVCDSGLGECDPIGTRNATNDNYLDHHDWMGRWQVVGYHHATRRLLVGVWGVWDGYLLGVHASAPPAILYRAHSLSRQNRHEFYGGLSTAWRPLLAPKLFPAYLQPTGHGDYFGPRWVYDAHLNDGQMGLFSYYIGPDPAGLRLTAAWGDTVVEQDGDELVRVEQRVEPGDVLGAALVEGRDVFGHEAGGTMLYRIGARGGVAPLWPEPFPDLWPSGIDASPGGRVCLADARNRRLVERSPAEEDRIPVDTTLDAAELDVVDCQYEDDDTLLLLMTDPPRVERWRRGETETEVVETLTGRPGLFVREPPGATPHGYSVIDVDGELRGALPLADGTRLEVRTGDGSKVVETAATLSYFDYGERWELVERPDGLVVALPVQPVDAYDGGVSSRYFSYPGFYHRGAGRAVPVATLDERVSSTPWVALARVPGGVGRDPWTGEPLASGSVWPVAGAPDSPEQPVTGPDPLGPPKLVAPSGGEVVGKGSDGGGCAQAPAPLGVAWPALALMGVVLAARRRRARGEGRLRPRWRGRTRGRSPFPSPG